MRRPILLVAAASLLAGCSAPLFAEIDVPELRITMPSQSFPATTPAFADLCAGTPGCIARSLDYDVGEQVPGLSEKNVSYDIRLTEFALTLTAGAGDLGGVDSVRVILLDGSPDGIIMASYAQPAGAAPTTITVSGNSNVNVGPYLADGKLPVRIELTYDPANPPPDFTADVTVALSIVVTVDWGSYL